MQVICFVRFLIVAQTILKTMATRMLMLVQPQRQRISLRLNDDNRAFFYRSENPLWIRCIDGMVMASATASIQFDQNGKRMHISSVPGHPQVILLANTVTNRTIGQLAINDSGAVALRDAPVFALTPDFPMYWSQKTTAIIGIDGSFTANLLDKMNGDEDIVRLKPGQNKVFRPNHWLQPSAEYDVVQPVANNHLVTDLIEPIDVQATGRDTFAPIMMQAAAAMPHIMPTIDFPLNINTAMQPGYRLSQNLHIADNNTNIMPSNEQEVVDSDTPHLSNNTSDSDTESEAAGQSSHSTRGGRKTTRGRPSTNQ